MWLIVPIILDFVDLGLDWVEIAPKVISEEPRQTEFL